jgi:transcription elongation factor
LFVEQTRNVQILGQEFIKGTTGKAIGSLNRRVKDDIIGKIVAVIKGEWKGYRGRVTQADDKQVIVEITSKCRKIPIDRTFVTDSTGLNDTSTGGN